MQSEQAVPKDCSIRIDKEGTWFYNDLPIVNRAIYLFFNQHITVDDDGTYSLKIGNETCRLIVEDTPYVVVDVWLEEEAGPGQNTFQIRLNDETQEQLNLETLIIREDNSPCCRVKNEQFPARFLRPAYYRLAEHVVQDEAGRFYIPLNDRNYYLS